jgi:hypothetical protein
LRPFDTRFGAGTSADVRPASGRVADPLTRPHLYHELYRQMCRDVNRHAYRIVSASVAAQTPLFPLLSYCNSRTAETAVPTIEPTGSLPSCDFCRLGGFECVEYGLRISSGDTEQCFSCSGRLTDALLPVAESADRHAE